MDSLLCLKILLLCVHLPLLRKQLPAMIKYGMDIQRLATEYLNPQIPVTNLDQPLFELTVYVQWKWPELTVSQYMLSCWVGCGYSGLH